MSCCFFAQEDCDDDDDDDDDDDGNQTRLTSITRFLYRFIIIIIIITFRLRSRRVSSTHQTIQQNHLFPLHPFTASKPINLHHIPHPHRRLLASEPRPHLRAPILRRAPPTRPCPEPRVHALRYGQVVDSGHDGRVYHVRYPAGLAAGERLGEMEGTEGGAEIGRAHV